MKTVEESLHSIKIAPFNQRFYFNFVFTAFFHIIILIMYYHNKNSSCSHIGRTLSLCPGEIILSFIKPYCQDLKEKNALNGKEINES